MATRTDAAELFDGSKTALEDVAIDLACDVVTAQDVDRHSSTAPRSLSVGFRRGGQRPGVGRTRRSRCRSTAWTLSLITVPAPAPERHPNRRVPACTRSFIESATRSSCPQCRSYAGRRAHTRAKLCGKRPCVKTHLGTSPPSPSASHKLRTHLPLDGSGCHTFREEGFEEEKENDHRDCRQKPSCHEARPVDAELADE